MKTLSDAKNTAIRITSAFEGTGYTRLVGSFDGAGFTYGLFGFNLKSGTLQKLIKKMYQTDTSLFRECTTVYVDEYKKKVCLGDILIKELLPLSTKKAIQWAEARQERSIPHDHWIQAFFNLGKEIKFQALQKEYAENVFEKAIKYCKEYNLLTEKALCFFFDIIIQQGSIKLKTKAKLLLRGIHNRQEADKYIILCEEMALQANVIWQKDVLSRRKCISHKRGYVHGKYYDLVKDYSLSDNVVIRK